MAGSAALVVGACRLGDGAAPPSGAVHLAALRARLAPASLDVAWRTIAGQSPRPSGWKRLDVDSPPDLNLSAMPAADPRALNADLPISAATGAPAPPFRSVLDGANRERALYCLTEAIYYEAALEPDAGQAAVAQVILNRVRHPAFPHSVCAVVYQGAGAGVGCQFTYVCDGARSRRPSAALWARARSVAEKALAGAVMPGVGAAIAYHADYVFPRWAPTMTKVAQIGAHIFYRFPGPWGRSEALRQRYAGGEPRATPDGPAAALSFSLAGAPGRPAVGVAAFHDRKIESGRRAPTPDEIAQINAALLEMDRKLPAPPDPARPAP